MRITRDVFNFASLMLVCALSLSCAGPPKRDRLSESQRPLHRIEYREDLDLQQEIDKIAEKFPRATILLAAGTYRPQHEGQALLHLNSKHNGLKIMGEDRDRVILTAQASVARYEVLAAEGKLTAVAPLAPPESRVIVNHVVYFGDGVDSTTELSQMSITGARGYLTKTGERQAEPNTQHLRRFIFYADGGGVKIWGKSSPQLRDLKIEDNWALYCGGGVSIEQFAQTDEPVRIQRVIFKGNRVPLTGAAIDLLPGSSAIVEDSVFEANQANDSWIEVSRVNEVRREFMRRQPHTQGTDAHPDQGQGPSGTGLSQFTKSSAITVFRGSSIELRRSEFKGNSGGLDFLNFVRWYSSDEKLIRRRRLSLLEDLSFARQRLHDIKGIGSFLGGEIRSQRIQLEKPIQD
ncbi:MAG TPA: hypothetical protein PLZ57_06665 [Pseudobdellovibrionaceae bacterium]|nr:hypothetical protein [Pseudobdellovibrionaceae bacterium]